jgi:hypothetical protein
VSPLDVKIHAVCARSWGGEVAVATSCGLAVLDLASMSQFQPTLGSACFLSAPCCTSSTPSTAATDATPPAAAAAAAATAAAYRGATALLPLYHEVINADGSIV